jgi:UDP-galactopyranose mutase
MYDYLIVGAGFAGSVMAERLASQQNARVLIIDKRNHIGRKCVRPLRRCGHTGASLRAPHLPLQQLGIFEYLSRSPRGDHTSTGCSPALTASSCPSPSISIR